MTITINSRAFNQDRNSPDSIVYAGPNNTLTTKDTLTVGRVYPKPVKDFDGVARPSAKLVRTVTLANGESAEAILTLSASLPAGMTNTDIDGMIDDMKGFVGLEDAGTTTLLKNLKIGY